MLYSDGALLLLEKCKNNAVEFDWVDGRRTVGGGGGLKCGAPHNTTKRKWAELAG